MFFVTIKDCLSHGVGYPVTYNEPRGKKGNRYAC